MLEKIDLEEKLSKKDYDKQYELLGEKLGELQRAYREANIPMLILFEGWHGSLRSQIINNLMQKLDARGFRVYSALKFKNEEENAPLLKSFWQRLPAKGGIAVYHRGWYFPLKESLLFDKDKRDDFAIDIKHINAFEKELFDDDYAILKFFIHLSEKQVKKNLDTMSKNYGKAWEKLEVNDDKGIDYQDCLKVHEQILAASDTEEVPWHIISGDDRRYAEIQIYQIMINYLQAFLKKIQEKKAVNKQITFEEKTIEKFDVLSKVDLSCSIDKEDYKDKLEKCQKKLRSLQIDLFESKKSAIFAFEGWDAGGKGGAIRRLTDALDPLVYQVNPISAPNDIERRYHYLWRFWTKFPNQGEISIFDRSWYGRLMVERVEHFASDGEWKRAYAEINDMEAQLVEQDTLICKFWMQIDADEQYKRFKERQDNPFKNWKITDEDWRNREKWSSYEDAVNEMLVKTSTVYAPWTIVEGNCKYFARLKVLETVIEALEKHIK